MALASLGLALSSHHTIRLPLAFCVRKVRHSGSVAAVESVVEPVSLVKEEGEGGHVPVTKHGVAGRDSKGHQWKKLSSEELGISTKLISKPTKTVLNGLRRKGYEVYLVGGCVRDLILKRTPKDFDVITSAGLKEVRKTFSRCEIVGKRFPICHVHVNDTIVEVSSFSTSGSGSKSSCKFGNYFSKPSGCNEHDYIRWRNCLQRDFTINGLMYDPYTKIVFDYMGGMEDIRKAKVRTVIPANVSFVDDCARILRAVRIAARLRFRFTREIALSVRELSSSVSRLDKGRILMEMNYMLAFGSAEASLRLLWRFGLLEILLPIQASYFASQGFRRRDERSNMLLSLFSNLDKLVAPNQPCHSSLWIAILAFHKALVDQPRDPLVIAAFSIAVHSGGSLFEAVEIARRISQPHDQSFDELLDPRDLDFNNALIDHVFDLAASVKTVLCKMTDPCYVSQAMSKYPQAPCSDLVFIPWALSLRVSKIFECVIRGMERGSVPRRGKKINYESLALGSLKEVRHVFARIVIDTIYPPNPNRKHFST
ncbi:uncharacterized protein LOC111988755 isoform X1 [Quercus suber]|uniref:uncharacterized protein LOC111988755 isoform X1 n=1 Tax=Quercus suber TaxID=58331 RepID=UPI000CE1C06C|nr:uncharacterized protein LOC111988755 isoform X1 [Quercus suber]POE81358.1 poly(a) polymerase i [Quercus suber]